LWIANCFWSGSSAKGRCQFWSVLSKTGNDLKLSKKEAPL
jgi:hypothetical protein